MHDDITSPEGSRGVVVTLKSKMAASSASSGGNSKIIVSFDLSESSNKSPEPLLDGPATSEHMSALLPFKFPASGKYDAILDSFVTTTTTMHVRAAKVLFYVILHKVYWWAHGEDRVYSHLNIHIPRKFNDGCLTIGNVGT